MQEAFQLYLIETTDEEPFVTDAGGVRELFEEWDANAIIDMRVDEVKWYTRRLGQITVRCLPSFRPAGDLASYEGHSPSVDWTREWETLCRTRGY